MSLRVYVDAYSGYRSNERPRQFILDEGIYEIEAVEDRWYSPGAEFFKVRCTDGKRYLLRYDQEQDQWSLQSGFDGAELLMRPSIQLVPVDAKTIRDAEWRIAGCERCRPDLAELPFDWILAAVTNKHGPFEFVLTDTARCPNCRNPLLEKTLIEPEGGN